MSDELTPITRKETFLAKAGGQSVETPTPITREETFLQAIIDNGGGGGGGGGGVLLVHEDVVTNTLDKTWQEINDADMVVIHFTESGTTFRFYPLGCYEEDGAYYIGCIGYHMPDEISLRTYYAETANDYPVYD